jgi:exopolysaccharide biosynthesis polyprenyl glycosylphosphotransferase
MNELAHHTLRETLGEAGRRTTGAGMLGLIKSPRGILALVIIADSIALSVAFLLFYTIRVNSGIFYDLASFPLLDVLQLTFYMLVFWMILFWFSGIYIAIHNRALFDEYYSVLKMVVIGAFIIFAAVYFGTGSSGGGSHRFISILIYFLLVAGMMGLGRALVRGVVRRLRRRGIGLRRTIIVGDSSRSRQLLEMFSTSPELGYAVIGTVTTTAPASDEFRRLSIGSVDEIDRIIALQKVEVTVLGMERERDLVQWLMTETTVPDTTIKIIPDLYDIVSGQARAQHLYGMPLIEVNPRIMPAWEQHLKRMLDISFSFAVIVVGLPFWLLTALAIKLEDRGPIFYSQERMGLGGKTFMVHKFRSMRPDAERTGISWTSVNDPRVTTLGRILRRFHIDEVPQFWNVLIGSMSLVGPRPERPFYVEKYSQLIPSYPRRLRVKPGLTGWNQVVQGEITETVEFVQERLRQDFFYIENMSLRLDIEIVFRTIIRVLQRKGQA